ncbi:MAG: MFS transporter [Pseudonocardiaceae bacterium]
MTYPQAVALAHRPDRVGIRRLLGTRGFGRLLTSRLAAQWGDGVFQAGLGGAVLFNPERQADPVAVAVGLAVLLLPYSLVGPFAGALLDRWDRSRVLVVANLLRAAPIVLVALAVGSGMAGAPLYLGALLVTGVSRFVLAGLSAGLPHVVGRRQLIEANALAATIGAAVTVVGGMCAVGLRALVGSGDTGSAWVTASAVAGSLVAAAAAAGWRRGQLGPDCADEPGQTPRAVLRGWCDGVAAAVRVPSVAAGMLALVAHRLAFGITTLVALLLYRNSFTSDGLLRAGFAGVLQLLVAGAGGLLLAAVLTPLLVARLGRRRTVCGALLAAGVVIVTLGLPMVMPTMLAAAFALAAAGQVMKLSLDATVQRDIDDAVRGRVFALYDAVFNIAYVLAVTVAAIMIPQDGHAPALLLLAGATPVITAALYHLIDPPAHSAGSAGLSGV